MSFDDTSFTPAPAQHSLPDPVDALLDDVKRRLITYYRDKRGLEVAVVTECIKRVEDGFAGATVRHFLPVLVERAVKAELGG